MIGTAGALAGAVWRGAAKFGQVNMMQVEHERRIGALEDSAAAAAATQMQEANKLLARLDERSKSRSDQMNRVGGEVRWDWPLYDRIAAAMKRAAHELDIPVEWGGDWRSFKDGPHWQLPWGEYPA